MRKPYLLILSFIICITASAQKPSRTATLDYINKIIAEAIDFKIQYKDDPDPNVLTKSYLKEFSKLSYENKKYSIGFTEKYEKDESGRVYKRSFYFSTINFKKMTNMEVSDYSTNQTTKPASVVKFLVITLEYKTITRRKRFWRDDEYKEITDETFLSTYVLIPFLTNDPDNETRLRRAFLRLQELDSEDKDLFLD
ncbi:MAG TPA: hypothetical protein VHL77_06835 [Ferruginibacter sp.]|nr:hypothetical protein [Ferruginibacter sp.]